MGVGISGKEGLQAARASNYCLGRFRFLSRLLLVHGRYSYKRTAAMMQYSFYRSLFIAAMQLQFNCFAGFSGVSFFHSSYVAAWAVITVFPAISLSFDKDVSEQSCYLFPSLYQEGQQGRALSLWTFARWAMWGTVQSVLVFFLTKESFGTEYMHPSDGAPIDFDSAGMTMYTAALFVQIGVVYVEHNSLHRWNHMLNAFCLLLFFCTYAFFGVVYVRRPRPDPRPAHSLALARVAGAACECETLPPQHHTTHTRHLPSPPTLPPTLPAPPTAHLLRPEHAVRIVSAHVEGRDLLDRDPCHCGGGGAPAARPQAPLVPARPSPLSGGAVLRTDPRQEEKASGRVVLLLRREAVGTVAAVRDGDCLRN